LGRKHEEREKEEVAGVWEREEEEEEEKSPKGLRGAGGRGTREGGEFKTPYKLTRSNITEAEFFNLKTAVLSNQIGGYLTYCNTLHNVATNCNVLQHTATLKN